MSFAHGTSTTNHHLKAYNNDIMNPALPPKLHKSLTNLKSSSSSGGNSHQQQQQQPHNNINMVATGISTTTNNTTHRNYSHNNSKLNDLNTNSNNSNTTSTNTVLNCNNTSSTTSSYSPNPHSNSSSSNSTTHNNSPSPYLTAVALANCSSSSPSSSSTTSVQTIYTLSKPSSSSSSSAAAASIIGHLTTCTSTPSNHRSSKDHHDHIMKIQPPSLTLPLSTTSTTSSFTSSTSKINSSTFYPLQNNVTYTLPKNVGGGKMSLNSTINSVVSKVPSVISLPPTGTEQNNNHYNYSGYSGSGLLSSDCSYNSHQYLNEMNGGASTSATTSKSTTLPKILRSKRDVHNSSLTPSNINCNPNNTTSSSSSSSSASASTYAVSQCSMPAYPKQYASTSSGGVAASNSANTSNGTQHQSTNINNMQTQTITSTLAVNYCPEDSHLNSHSIQSNSAITNVRSTSPSISSNQNVSKQLPVCTTSKNCLNPKEHFLPNDTSLDDDYLSECENCKIAQSSKYYLNAEALTNIGGPQETMTLQRKSLEECKEEPDTGYYRISHTLPTNSKKNV